MFLFIFKFNTKKIHQQTIGNGNDQVVNNKKRGRDEGRGKGGGRYNKNGLSSLTKKEGGSQKMVME